MGFGETRENRSSAWKANAWWSLAVATLDGLRAYVCTPGSEARYLCLSRDEENMPGSRREVKNAREEV